MRQFLTDEDNQSAICLARNTQLHGRTKHIGIKYHFFRGQVEKGTVELQYCPTEKMIADMLTKRLSRDQFIRLRLMSGLIQMLDLVCEGEGVLKNYVNFELHSYEMQTRLFSFH